LQIHVAKLYLGIPRKGPRDEIVRGCLLASSASHGRRYEPHKDGLIGFNAAVTEDEDSDTATLQTSAATAALATRTMLLPEFENAEVTRLFGVRWHRTHFQIRTQYSRTFHLPIDWNNSDFDWAC
jgi:hypothetical protein